MDLGTLEVTYTNENLMYFKCKNNSTIFIINAGLSCAYYRLQLPKVGTTFCIDQVNNHFTSEYIIDERILSLCHKKYPRALKSTNLQHTNDTLRAISKYRLGCGDLMILTKMFESVQNKVPHEIILKFIQIYTEKILQPKVFTHYDVPDCHINQLPKIILLTISQLKQVQVHGNFYTEFPYWSFGTHWNLEHEILIGELFVHPKSGTICLKDAESTTGCIIIKNFFDDLREILDKTVYFEKYCILSEIFNPNTKVNLEYLFVNFKDIHVLEFKRKREIEVQKLKYKMTFLLLNKSNVTYTHEKGYHFWIEIKHLRHYKEEIERCFLCLPVRLIQNWAFLEVSHYYTLTFTEHLATTRDYEYIRANPNLPQLILRQANFSDLTLNDEYHQPQNLPFLDSKTLPEILGTQGLVSFQAILKYRKFTPNISSRTMSSNIPTVFGTIGEKTHILDFQVDNVKTLAVYLNNWERMLTPLGLIPGALVNVRNVIVQRTYCKSTAFTLVELADYKPQSQFQTVRLLTEDDWGPEYYLGGTNSLPNGVLIHCVLIKYKVINLFIKRSCVDCSYMSRVPGKICNQCGGQMGTICEMVVNAQDKQGSSKINIKMLDMVRAFLGMEQEMWEKWLQTLEYVGQYRFERFGKFVNYALNDDQVSFVRKMNYIVRNGERKNMNKVHVLCRKLDNSRNYKKSETFWFGLKAKIVGD